MKSYMEGSSAPPRQLRMILPFIGLLTLVFASLHYFVYLVITRTSESSLEINFVRFALVFGLISIPLGFICSRINHKPLAIITWAGYIWMGFFNFLFFFSAIEISLSFFVNHHFSIWVMLASLVISVWSLYKGLKNPTVAEHSLQNEKLKDFSLVQISDLHIGMLHLRKNWLKNVVDKINSLKPDVIAITGDLVEGRYSEVSADLEVLADLNKQTPKFYITGNHEYIHGGSIWEKRLHELGFTILHNTHSLIKYNNATVMIAGVPDKMAKRFNRTLNSQPDLALKTNIRVDYKILLAHQPSSVFDLVNEKCDLILSGHTHGGQIFPFHFFVRLAQPVVAGFKKINGILVFAHQGTGFWGPPMRWFSQSEIVKINWK